MITAGLSSSYAKFYPSTRIVNRKIVNREKCRIVVVGGGLSGTAIASSLGRRGYRVQLLEQEQRLAQRASGNSAGIVMPHISARPDLMSRFYLSGYICLLQELKCLINKGLINSWKQCGVLRLATSSRLGSLISVLPRLEITEEVVCAYEPSEAQELVGFNVSCPGLYFPHGGSLSPVELCAANLKSVDGSVEVLYGSKIVKLERVQDAWRLFDASLQLVAEAEVVILAGGYEMLEFSQLSWLPLEKVRGQVFNIPATAESRLLKTVVCYDGYIIPECNQAHFIGATFDHGNDSTLIDAAQNQDLLSRLYTAMPDFPELDLKHAQARVSFRTMSRDRLPIIGPVPDRTLFAAEYKARKLQTLPTESNLQGLYVSVGHGSRGLTSCHLAAELIASLINDEPLPLEQDLAEALFPARYLAREIKVSRV